MSLELRGVCVDYDRTRVVRDVSATVAAQGSGPVTAILGPSGCGKSTLLRAIAGLQPLAAGTILFDGEDLAGIPVHRRDFGMVFQEAQLFGGRSVADNVAYGLRARRWSRAAIAARVEAMLDLVRLPGLADRRVEDLSGGQAQRVALARALAPGPRLLLLDEPLAALDANLRGELADDIVDIVAATATPTIVVTHDHDEAATMGEQVVVMRDGAIVAADTASRVWRYPRDEWTARFLGWEHLLPVSGGDGDLRTELGVVRAADAGLEPGRRASAVAIRAESLRARPASSGDRAEPPVLPVLRVRELPGRTQVVLDGSGLAAPIAELGALLEDGGAGAPAPGDPMAVTLVGARTGIVAAPAAPGVVVAGAVIRDGRLLLAQRSYPPRLAGRWELPGGKVEADEDDASALVRELAEELAIEVEVGGRIGADVVLREGLVLRAYRARWSAGEPVTAEHSAVRWVTAGELAAMADGGELVPADAGWVPELTELLRPPGPS
ncbi:ATP-binding cassette domain-containing protein [Gordonia sp. X0973]|uniref:ATP-binding cassette domain-containing protein n=1 Tax=Gordonia sp. X0973 TaxID=2742602 RepID=UPI0026574566|nr:ATP-binding cassette domain-containing protein [Gordonia sp. X0973]